MCRVNAQGGGIAPRETGVTECLPVFTVLERFVHPVNRQICEGITREEVVDVFNTLLQILDDGRLTDGHGRTVDFKNTVVIMTSNVGVELIKRDTTIGFAAQRKKSKTRKQVYDSMKDKVLTEVKKTFRPEFLNRIDEIIVFHELTEEQLRSIIDLLVKDLQKRLAEHKLEVKLTDKAKSWLAKAGYDPVYGARPLRRAIERYVENPLSTKILRGEFSQGDTIKIDLDDEGLTFTAKATVEAAA